MTAEELTLEVCITVVHQPDEHCSGQADLGMRIIQANNIRHSTCIVVTKCSNEWCRPIVLSVRQP